MPQEKKKEVELRIQLDEDTAQGRYSNRALVHHGDAEFVLDFLFVQPQTPTAKVCSRVVLAPRNAKRLLITLKENVDQYEQSFGPIELRGPQRSDEGEFH